MALDRTQAIEKIKQEGGIYVPIRTGNSVYYSEGHTGEGERAVGAGPDVSTANASLKLSNAVLPLWINDVQASFSATGEEAQSRMLREFFPRDMGQVRLQLLGQTANQKQYNGIAKFIRAGMLGQLTDAPSSPEIPGLFTLTIKGGYSGSIAEGKNPAYPKDAKHRPFTAVGYIEKIEAGGEHFVNAPTYSFEFVIVNVSQGWMAGFDSIATVETTKNLIGKFLAPFNRSVADPNIDPPTPFKGQSQGDKPPKKPRPESKPDKPTEREVQVAHDIGVIFGTLLGEIG